MLRYATAYFATAAVFLVLDFVWLSRAASFYRFELGGLLAERPNLIIAGFFYALYISGILVLAVLPAERNGSWITALLLGGLLGLVAYGTYDLTNLSTLEGWSPKVALVDLVWGTLLTAASSLSGYATIALVFRGN
ncbi:DUF2177 family protein [Afipia birgiae]|jgi:uncharacterized membrane protein|uniref:DUF2177 family protein n=1 Tax=Afipia birgiae TaxID=151414 RepID=UPI0003807E8C|nr:DUF2177 family protein [Afipia birgiae]